MVMNSYHGYQLYQADRGRSRAEIIEADMRLGQMAAAASRLSRILTQGLDRGLRRRRTRSPRPRVSPVAR
jgi:hypothetical protein